MPWKAVGQGSDGENTVLGLGGKAAPSLLWVPDFWKAAVKLMSLWVPYTGSWEDPGSSLSPRPPS